MSKHDVYRRWQAVIMGLFFMVYVLTPFSFAEDSENGNEVNLESISTYEKSSEEEGFTVSFTQMIKDGVKETFEKETILTVPLGEVIILVFLVNIFALIRKSRLIMIACFLFCFKWVLYNYSDLFAQSNTVAMMSTGFFVLCGILTTVLFCVDRVSSDS